MARNSFLCADVPLRNYSLTCIYVYLLLSLPTDNFSLHDICAGPGRPQTFFNALLIHFQQQIETSTICERSHIC